MCPVSPAPCTLTIRPNHLPLADCVDKWSTSRAGKKNDNDSVIQPPIAFLSKCNWQNKLVANGISQRQYCSILITGVPLSVTVITVRLPRINVSSVYLIVSLVWHIQATIINFFLSASVALEFWQESYKKRNCLVSLCFINRLNIIKLLFITYYYIINTKSVVYFRIKTILHLMEFHK